MAIAGFYPPPPTFPMPELTYLATAVPAGTVTRRDGIQASLNILGYANSVLGDKAAADKLSKAAKASGKPNKKKLAELLKQAADQKDATSAAAFPWALLAAELLKLLAQLWGG